MAMKSKFVSKNSEIHNDEFMWYIMRVWRVGFRLSRLCALLQLSIFTTHVHDGPFSTTKLKEKKGQKKWSFF